MRSLFASLSVFIRVNPWQRSSCVDRDSVDAVGRVQHGFRQSWVRVNCPHQVFDGRFEFHGSDGFGDQLCRLGADDVHA